MGTQEVTERFPAYDLGYLLRRLPTHICTCSKEPLAGRPIWTKMASITEWELRHPEDAATKLAIELIKQGILN